MKLAAYVLADATFPEGIITRCYVGETVDMLARINRHSTDPQKSFVSEAFVIGSVDPSYDKIDVQLLQYRLNNEIERADRAYIVRGARPALPQVDSARIAQGDRDFEDVRRLLPSIGCNILESREVSFPKTKGDREHQAKADHFAQPRGDGPIRGLDRRVSDAEARSRTKDREATVTDLKPRGLTPRTARFVFAHAGFVAYGYQHGHEFIVLPGSQMRRAPMPSFEEDMVNVQRGQDVINAGVFAKVKDDGDCWQLAEERRFPSRSIAAKVLIGVNLRIDAWEAVTIENILALVVSGRGRTRIATRPTGKTGLAPLGKVQSLASSRSKRFADPPNHENQRLRILPTQNSDEPIAIRRRGPIR